ncbi:uncharacterized protein LOC120275360 isoform X2 [Dioscorea cayenensis subsp. rotundata]|uniref:Uncharacterized protein LOC120275360 isoform X2 n=1 Tax=Dioscorea cayennensis subsp. rotundata TaxID=55577 RepID=A0AB40CE18_DIOCR|nr:uncharacterized protein LOC120275360 isoform X2 [Dioscorea cayenensis subsp. rotundata]
MKEATLLGSQIGDNKGSRALSMSDKKKEAKKSSDLVNGRCHLAPLVSTLDELKKHMSQRHWEIIRMTPFSPLLDLHPIVQERGLLDGILQLFDDPTNTFKIGKSHVTFRPEDVSLILGLPCYGTVVKFKRQKPLSEFEEKYLKTSKDRQRDNIKKKLMEIVHHRSEENFVKLLVVYIMASFLFPHTTSSAPSWVGQYVDQLYTMGQYAWALAVHKFLMDGVPKAARCVKARRSDRKINTGYLRGCVIALNIWFYEVTGTGKKVHYGKVPRALCYGEKSFRKTVSISELIPLSNEENGILGTTWASRVDRPMTAEKVRKKAKVENINSPQQTPLHHSSNDSSKRSQEFNIMVHRLLESLELLMQAARNLRTCPEKPRESSSLTSLLDAIEWLDTIESVKEDV